MDECCKYIIGEAYKIAKDNRQGNCGSWCGINNDPIINLIIHYYQEDNVKPTKLPDNVHLATTPKQAKEIRKKAAPRKETKSNVVQLSLFD